MKAMLKIGIRIACLLALLGSQLNGGLPDETLISEFLNSFRQSVLAQDHDSFVSLFSDNESDAKGTARQSAREIMIALMDSGALYNLELPIKEANTVMNDDGTATVFPLRATGPNLNVTERLILVKEDGVWLISSIEIVEGHWQTVRAPASGRRTPYELRR